MVTPMTDGVPPPCAVALARFSFPCSFSFRFLLVFSLGESKALHVSHFINHHLLTLALL